MPHFALHSRLAADTIPIGDLPLCSVLLIDDSRYPWLILVPRRPDLREIVDLAAEDRAALIEEVAAASRALRAVTGAEKLNVAAIGNVVAQLHVHVVARFKADAAWPEPVWGRGSAVRYGAGAARETARRIAAELGLVRRDGIG